jgi:hypothetical protein
MDFEEFAEAVDENGIFRGFPKSWLSSYEYSVKIPKQAD